MRGLALGDLGGRDELRDGEDRRRAARERPFEQARRIETLAALGVLERLSVFFLTALLVQEDNLVSTSPFWVTRSISNARLLAAKFAGWLALLWLPAVVLTLPWWLVCGDGECCGGGGDRVVRLPRGAKAASAASAA